MQIDYTGKLAIKIYLYLLQMLGKSNREFFFQNNSVKVSISSHGETEKKFGSLTWGGWWCKWVKSKDLRRKFFR